MKSALRKEWLLIFTSCMFASCASLWPFTEEKKDASEAAQHQPKDAAVAQQNERNELSGVDVKGQDSIKSNAPMQPSVVLNANQSSDDDFSLKYSRLLSRLDELEGELQRQREKIKLLEQGLLTGIAPDELKTQKQASRNHGHGAELAKKLPVREDLSKPMGSNGDSPLVKPKLEDLSISDREMSDESRGDSLVMAKIQIAKEHYQAGRFGLAIADLVGLSREYGDKVQEGALKVWLGKSYLGLKEFQTARGEFESYIKGWPSGEYVASSRLDLARAYVGLGLRERARSELGRVLKDFDGDEYAEMAAAELKRIQGSL